MDDARIERDWLEEFEESAGVATRDNEVFEGIH